MMLRFPALAFMHCITLSALGPLDRLLKFQSQLFIKMKPNAGHEMLTMPMRLRRSGCARYSRVPRRLADILSVPIERIST